MNKKESYKFVMINLVIIGLVYCGLLHIHYATDTYNNIYNLNTNWQLSVGRYSIYILQTLFNLLGISLIKYQQIFMLLSIFILSVSLICMFELIKRININKEVNGRVIWLSLLLSIINVYILELFLFPEYSFYNSLGILTCICSICYLFKNKMLSYFFSFIFLVISLGFYQENISIFVISSLFLILQKREITYKNIFKIGCIVSLSAIFNIITQKLLSAMGIIDYAARDTTFGIKNIIDNIKIILSNQKDILITNSSLLIPGIFVISLFILLLLVFIVDMDKNKINIIQLIFVMCISYISVYAPHYIAENVWLSPRTIYPLYFFVGFLGIYLANSARKIYINITSVILIVLLGVNIWSIQGIILDHFSTNKIDQEYAFNIYMEIKSYEEKTGITIENIATINDMVPSWKNHFIRYYSHNVNERAFINDWSDVSLLNYVSSRNFKKIEMDPLVYKKYFEGKDWNYYNPQEQLYFDGSTLYWCKY